MKIRFRKSVKIAPGIRVNFSKSGVSTSIGPRGAKINLSKQGARVITGIPGTGLSASKLYRGQTHNRHSKPTTKEEWIISLIMGAITFGIMAYASEGFRPLTTILSIACLVGLYFLTRKPKLEEGSAMAATPLPQLGTEPRAPVTTWQERVAAIEHARTEPQHPSSPSSLMLNSGMVFSDHLGDAAEARRKAKASEQSGDFDAAWKYLHEEKHHFLLHSSQQCFSFENTLALDANVSEKMANILRKQRRHNDAFVHIAYWATAQKSRPIKRHNEKFRVYYNRADKMNVSLEEAWSIMMSAPIMDFSKVQLIVEQWLKPVGHNE